MCAAVTDKIDTCVDPRVLGHDVTAKRGMVWCFPKCTSTVAVFLCGVRRCESYLQLPHFAQHSFLESIRLPYLNVKSVEASKFQK
jgi:hypothetical protein